MMLMRARTRWQRIACLAHASVDKVLRPNALRIGVFPTVAGNPYFNLMYSNWRHNTYVVDLHSAIRMRKLGLLTVLHLHWDEFVFPPKDVSATATKFELLNKFSEMGGRIAWTMHNALPHRIKDKVELDRFFENRKKLVQACHVIHVHSQFAAEILISEYAAQPQKICVVAHPSYASAYPAPKLTEFSPRKNFLVFGIMHAAKGIDFICDAFTGLQSAEEIGELHLAGLGAEKYLGRINDKVRSVITPGNVPDESIPIFFGAAHFSVFGFQSTLTSGSLLLSFSMETPAIFPAYPSLCEDLSEGLLRLSYTPNDTESLQRAITRANAMGAKEYAKLVQDCRDFSAKFSSDRISTQLQDMIESVA